ncbi:hypothetical protein P148_SR1C00001G0748 [candidate division SR1 bacterium RAAC1_SR1_1]|nr:hypothetical protein P148_SR1C00001G0748 [candidate division SR1 bacterium RAAC1_SR1_1]
MKKKKNTNDNKTSNRGRPPKAFVSKKTQIKRDKPGRPKKHEKIVLPQIPEKKENKVKDAIIWALFIISFFVFGFSLYVSQKEKIAGLLSQKSTIPQEEIQIQETESLIEESIPQEPIPAVSQDEKFVILQNIYSLIQQAKFDEIYTHIDTILRQSSVFKTYFSKNRLQRFINNIDNQKISIELINIDNDTSKIRYKLSYSIKNVPFIEERETVFITKNDEQKIAKIMCITQGCSKMPFFNPGKYF